MLEHSADEAQHVIGSMKWIILLALFLVCSCDNKNNNGKTTYDGQILVFSTKTNNLGEVRERKQEKLSAPAHIFIIEENIALSTFQDWMAKAQKESSKGTDLYPTQTNIWKPISLTSTMSDADGKFTVSYKTTNKVRIVAWANRNLPNGEKENYFWLRPAGPPESSVVYILNNFDTNVHFLATYTSGK